MISYRKATPDDLDLLIRLRLAYLTEDSGLTAAETRAITEQLREYLPQQIGRSFAAYLAEAEGNAIASVYLAVAERPANPSNLTGKSGIVLNVFTYPGYRRQGIASRLLALMIADAKAMHLSYLDLSATPQGRRLYQACGFACRTQEEYTEMRLRF